MGSQLAAMVQPGLGQMMRNCEAICTRLGITEKDLAEFDQKDRTAAILKMGECGTKDITPGKHEHPMNEQSVAHGTKLGKTGMAILRATDLYTYIPDTGRQITARWIPIPRCLRGAVLREDFIGEVVRPV